MRETEIQYVNDLGYLKTFTAIRQKNGLYFSAILYRGEVASFEPNCTKEKIEEFRKKILNRYKIVKIIK